MCLQFSSFWIAAWTLTRWTNLVCTPLHRAHRVESGDSKAAECLIAHGANVNAPASNGGTPLHFAAEAVDAKAAEFLIARGANVNAHDEEGWTPLHFVAQSHKTSEEEKEKIEGLLLANGADLFAVAQDGRTPLRVALGRSPKTATRLIAREIEASTQDRPPYLRTLASLPAQTSLAVWRCVLRVCLLFQRKRPQNISELKQTMERAKTLIQNCTDSDPQRLKGLLKEAMELGDYRRNGVDDLTNKLASAAYHMCSATGYLIIAQVNRAERDAAEQSKPKRDPITFSTPHDLHASGRKQTIEALENEMARSLNACSAELATAYAFTFSAANFDKAFVDAFISAMREDLTRLTDSLRDPLAYPVKYSHFGNLWPIGEPIVLPEAQDALAQRSIEDLMTALRIEASSATVDDFVQIGTTAVPALIAALRDDSHSVRKCSAEALGRIGDLRAAQPLASALKQYDQLDSTSKDDDLRNLLVVPELPRLDSYKRELGKMETDAAAAAAKAIQEAIQQITLEAERGGQMPTPATLPTLDSPEHVDEVNAFPRLQCPACKRVYIAGIDASVVTMQTLAAFSAASISFRNGSSSAQTSVDRPALVGTLRRQDPTHEKKLIEISAAVCAAIRQSLTAGNKEYWYCAECKQDPPLIFPASWVAADGKGGAGV